jgi:hypothetical protein
LNRWTDPGPRDAARERARPRERERIRPGIDLLAGVGFPAHVRNCPQDLLATKRKACSTIAYSAFRRRAFKNAAACIEIARRIVAVSAQKL